MKIRVKGIYLTRDGRLAKCVGRRIGTEGNVKYPFVCHVTNWGIWTYTSNGTHFPDGRPHHLDLIQEMKDES